MTELIDIATLASLGQHFVSHEDMERVKNPVASLQNDLELIKQFLVEKFGSEFSNLLETGMKGGLKKIEPARTQEKKLSLGGVQNIKSEQTRSKPPPLQRFRRVNSRASDDDGCRENSLTITRQPAPVSSANRVTITNNTVTAVKSEKFHRNFLSMSSLGGGSQRMKRFSGGVSGLSAKTIKLDTQKVSSSGVAAKMPALRNISTLIKYKDEPREEENYGGMNDEEFNVSEGAFTAVAEVEYEEPGEDMMSYAGYEGEAEGEGTYQDDSQYYDEPNDQEVYQDEEGYDDSYPMESLQILETNGETDMSPATIHKAANGRRSTTASSGQAMKMVSQRRLSLPVANMSVNENSGDGDPNYLKKCKVCHDEVPSFSLFNHVIGVHYNGEIPTCHICKKTFTYKQGLISHMRYHDVDKYDKECSYCGKKFIRRSDVVIHERRLHTGERPFLCPVPDCKQAFVRRYCLVTHVKTNHGEPFMAMIGGRRPVKKESDD